MFDAIGASANGSGFRCGQLLQFGVDIGFGLEVVVVVMGGAFCGVGMKADCLVLVPMRVGRYGCVGEGFSELVGSDSSWCRVGDGGDRGRVGDGGVVSCRFWWLAFDLECVSVDVVVVGSC